MEFAATAQNLNVDTLLLNVAVIPVESVAAAAITLSQQLEAHGGTLRLDGIDRSPHLTLYMARFTRAAVENVREALSSLDTVSGGVQLRQVGYYVTPGSYYEVSYEKSPELVRVHSAVTNALQAFRFSPDMPVVEDYFGPYSAAQEANVRKSGYDLAGDLYRPHITITRFNHQRDLADLPTVSDDLSFAATKIGLFEADALGAARQLITSFELTPKPRT